ncbi:unnamed protein product [Rotaria magnacalcarata]|uniref:B30.2/SPRY domain-containing protein n=3 Tax=Rotaria magnacalcarata TaxID=392030 RepID=A0A816AZE5_9BILA|nr:unnamed protein product [Rotaria magnacalcarata]CAF1604645.1 unnamed protein product [Rotaria magnacalcarata]CAF3866693.1 unnamed protein product [Rotaria magnacalcarata]CAF3894337.1 unnamed protein product [Rotaria magnacalcarata]
MSWIVEQTENTSAVNVNGDTITCTNDGYYGSPINVMYKDPANQNGQYFWQAEFRELQESGGASIGLTTEHDFKGGWGLRAMKYLGNLSDGSGLLVSAFGEQISQNDKVGILLQLTSEDLKIYIFHNEKPLGLAFHVQAPYPKPLFPVVSFNANGKVKIYRSQEIPMSLERSSLEFTGINGNWKIIDYPQHRECVGYQFEIANENENRFSLHARVINSLNCHLQYNPANNQWKTSAIMSTLMAGPPEEMHKESLISSFISGIYRVETQGQHQLVIQTNNGDQARLERFAVPPPSPVTQNIFN